MRSFEMNVRSDRVIHFVYGRYTLTAIRSACAMPLCAQAFLVLLSGFSLESDHAHAARMF
jgi:hypothetical protein